MRIESSINVPQSHTVASLKQPVGLHSLFLQQPCEHLAAGQVLFLDGEAAKSIFEVVEGSLRIFRILPDGRRVITGFLHDGDILGLSLKSHYIYSAEAITGLTIRRLSRKAFEGEVANCAAIGTAVFSQMADEMAAAQDQMVLLSTKNAEERLCSFFLKGLRRTCRDGDIEPVVHLPMTRLDIADYLGLTVETVSRTVTKLIGKGVLAPAGRHAMKVLRRGVLAQLAGGGDEYEGEGRAFAARAVWSRH